MPSNINLANQVDIDLSLSTSVNPNLDSKYWAITSSTAPAGQSVQVLWMDRDEGITDGDTWIFTTTFTVAGVAVAVQESLTGTATGSTIQIQIVAGDRSIGFAPANLYLCFQGNDGNSYFLEGVFVPGDDYDDVTYTLSIGCL